MTDRLRAPVGGRTRENPSVALWADLRDAMTPYIEAGRIKYLFQVRRIAVPVLAAHRQRHGRIGSVVGIITAEGLEHKEANVEILRRSAEIIAEEAAFPVYSSIMIMPPALQRVLGPRIPQPLFRRHHREELMGRRVLVNGAQVYDGPYPLVTDMFLTPMWDFLPPGARTSGTHDEVNFARLTGIRLNDFSSHPDLLALRAELRPQ